MNRQHLTMLLAIGILQCVLGSFLMVSELRVMKACSEITSGVIIDIEVKKDVDSTLKSPVVQYTAGGVSYSVKSSLAQSHIDFRIGDTVTLFYDPDKPEQMKIDGYDELFMLIFGGIFAVAGSLIVFISISIYRYVKPLVIIGVSVLYAVVFAAGLLAAIKNVFLSYFMILMVVSAGVGAAVFIIRMMAVDATEYGFKLIAVKEARKAAADLKTDRAWLHYAQALEELLYTDGIKTAAIKGIVSKLYALSKKQNTPELWALYAESLVALSYRLKASGCERIVKKLHVLAASQNTPALWVQYAQGLESLAAGQDLAGMLKTTAVLKKAAAAHNTPELWEAYANALVRLSKEQHTSDRLKTVAELEKLAEKHDSQGIKNDYQEALSSVSTQDSAKNVKAETGYSASESIMHVDQIHSGTAKEFIITYKAETYTASASFLNKNGPIQLSSPRNGTWLLRYRMLTWKRLIPFGLGYLFDSFGLRPYQSVEYKILHNDQLMGSVSTVRYGIIKTKYEVKLDGLACTIYPLHKGSFEMMLVFSGDKQIAQIKRDTMTRDMLDCYQAYVPEDFASFRELIIMFILYYDHLEHGNQGVLHKGSSVQKSWSYSYGDAFELYDASWMDTHFPKELEPQVEFDIKQSRRLGRKLAFMHITLVLLYWAVLLLIAYALWFEWLAAIFVIQFLFQVLTYLNERSMYYKAPNGHR